MAISHITINTGLPPAQALRYAIQTFYSAQRLLADAFLTLDTYRDGSDYTGIDVAYGTTEGQALYNEMNSLNAQVTDAALVAAIAQAHAKVG